MQKPGLLHLCVVSLLALQPLGGAYGQNSYDTVFTKTNVMIAMRDGVRLNTDVYTPKHASGSLPFIMLRTPYGISHDYANFDIYLKDLVDEGYIFVFQDIRGRYRSEGTFDMQRFDRDRKDPKAVDESSDTYDTIEWLLHNTPGNNGRVGILGISYPGWLAVMAMLDPHPALKAVSEQATPADMFLGDDFHHNGAFRLSYGFEYAFELESSKTDTLFPFDTYDTYEWYLKLGALSNADPRYFHGKLPTWENFVQHPNYDEFWQQQALAFRLKRVTVPTMHVAGWWDQEDFYGPMKAYEVLEKVDAKNMNYLVVGPWNHGGWGRMPGNRLGNIDFQDSTGVHFRRNVQAPWFAYYLKDKGKGDFPEALTFRTGANTWQRYTEWPPRTHSASTNLYFMEGERLAFSAPVGDKEAYDEFVSDPAHPVPYRSRPIEETYGPGSRWRTWLVEDQRFVHLRPDVLSWETDPLTEVVVIAGQITADIFASTSGSDADWIVKLIDVYPEQNPSDPRMAGYQLMVANDVLRGRFRKSFEKPEPVKPGEVNEFRIDLHGNDHAFLKGHKIMVQLQSTWFPVIDRNPQKYVDNIFFARDSDFQTAVHRVFRSKKFPSHILLPVVTK